MMRLFPEPILNPTEREQLTEDSCYLVQDNLNSLLSDHAIEEFINNMMNDPKQCYPLALSHTHPPGNHLRYVAKFNLPEEALMLLIKKLMIIKFPPSIMLYVQLVNQQRVSEMLSIKDTLQKHLAYIKVEKFQNNTWHPTHIIKKEVVSKKPHCFLS